MGCDDFARTAARYGKLLKRRRLKMEAEQEGKKYDSIT
jgi:hypothetical protein